MPTVGVKAALLFQALGQTYTEEEFADLCFEYGLELDEVTSEKQMLSKEQGSSKAEGASEEIIFRVDIPANRYDLLCLEGLVRALLIFKGKIEPPRYRALQPAADALHKMYVKPSTAEVRPYVVAAILRDVTFTQDRYNSFIDLQDKLHQNIGRRRAIVSIGTHDLDTVQGPFVYDARDPKEIRFVPLNDTVERTAEELMDLYAKDSHLRHYLHIIKDKPVYPVIEDANGTVLSLPPIINGNHSKITLSTRNVLIEVTATDLHKSKVVLDTMVTMFSEYCKEPFIAEKVQVIMPDGTATLYPELKYWELDVHAKDINELLGLSKSEQELCGLLGRMSLQSKVADGDRLHVEVPPTRHDVLHAADVYEDVAVSYGYDNLPREMPPTSTTGRQLPINKLTEQLRFEMAHAGFTEALTFALCSEQDIAEKIRKPDGCKIAVHVSNPKTLEFQVARTTLLPGLLKTLNANKKMPLPLKLFEISDVVFKDDSDEIGAVNQRHLCALYCGKTTGFEIVHGLLDRTMQLLSISFGDGPEQYHLRPIEDTTFFPGRCAEVVVRGKALGTIGVLHPEVIVAFDLSLPCSVLEINIEPFV
uniref:Phenylalanine--tRNA ligase beta subunit n=1 Tax=Amblyomma sculptum TaxID=1581419 RepID=A0A1E1XU16_AMBSC